MADIHVLRGDGTTGPQAYHKLVFHFPVPDNSNQAGISYRDALVNSGLGGTTDLPDGDGTDGTISAAEKTQIEAGELYEHSKGCRIESGGSLPAQVQAAIRGYYAQELAVMQPQIQAKLRFFGHTESAT